MSTVVARLGKPHGIRGEFTVEVRTDDPDERFVPGAVFTTEPDSGDLTLSRARWHRDRLLLTFEEVPDRTRAEELRNTLISAAVDETDDDDAWYIDDLVGLDAGVLDAEQSFARIGTVDAVTQGAAQDLLHIRLESGAEALVPFVEQIVPTVDMDSRRIILDPPAGLIEGI